MEDLEEIERMKEDVLEVFTTSQKSTSFHQKNAIILKEYYEIVSLMRFKIIISSKFWIC